MNEQLKPYKTVEEIAKKHRLEVSFIQKQLDMGAPIEHEHTKNQKLAIKIALQHLDEIPDYYTRLKKMEASAKKEHKKFKDVTEAKKMKGKDPCWKGYEMIGKKNKNGKEVPNCVPVKEETGMVRYCPKCKKDETQSECKYGPKFWAMYSTPSMLTTNQLKYDISQVHPANESKEPDHEHSMARSELSTIVSAAKRLRKKMKGEGNIKAWVQSKITKAADYIDTAADYLDSSEGVSEAKKCWPGYKKKGTQKLFGKTYNRCVKEGSITFLQFMDEASAAWQRKEGKNPEGGLNAKGVASYRKENPGSKLQTAVTTKPSKLKPGSKSAKRRKSFCARMGGMPGPMKDEKGHPTRKALSLRKWNC